MCAPPYSTRPPPASPHSSPRGCILDPFEVAPFAQKIALCGVCIPDVLRNTQKQKSTRGIPALSVHQRNFGFKSFFGKLPSAVFTSSASGRGPNRLRPGAHAHRAAPLPSAQPQHVRIFCNCASRISQAAFRSGRPDAPRQPMILSVREYVLHIRNFFAYRALSAPARRPATAERTRIVLDQIPKNSFDRSSSARCTISGWCLAPSSPRTPTKSRRQIEIELHRSPVATAAHLVNQLDVNLPARKTRLRPPIFLIGNVRRAIVRARESVHVASLRAPGIFRSAGSHPKVPLQICRTRNLHHAYANSITLPLPSSATACRKCRIVLRKSRTRSNPCSTPLRSYDTQFQAPQAAPAIRDSSVASI